jgi:mRNA-degrading endonuclease RelE of RelBE toxin-antitoxin system
MEYTIIYAPQFRQHLRSIERKFYSLIRDTIVEQLHYEPTLESRNRKPLKRPTEFDANWEIRFGPDNRFRVFYSVNQDLIEVYVLAIGVKLGNRLFIDGQEYEL